MSFETKPLNDGVGAEVLGLDLDAPIGDSLRQDLYDAWLDAGVLLFRGIGTSSTRHLSLSRCFGELEIHPIEALRSKEHPEIINLATKGDQELSVHYIDDEPLVGMIPWHTDMIYAPTPCRGALLRMVEKPARGGRTGWVDTAAAYDALSEEMKARIEPLEAHFVFVADACDMRFGRPASLRHGPEGQVDFPEFPPVAHPIVWKHPESGRKALMLSPVQLIEVVGMDREEGDPLLEKLVDHVTHSRFRYVHDWEVDDMVLWDNWRTMHSAFGTPLGCHRVVQRTTLKGEHTTGRLL